MLSAVIFTVFVACMLGLILYIDWTGRPRNRESEQDTGEYLRTGTAAA